MNNMSRPGSLVSDIYIGASSRYALVLLKERNGLLLVATRVSGEGEKRMRVPEIALLGRGEEPLLVCTNLALHYLFNRAPDKASASRDEHALGCHFPTAEIPQAGCVDCACCAVPTCRILTTL